MPVVSRPICRHSSDANKVDSISDMYDILAVELSCYRGRLPQEPIGCHT